MKDGYFWNSCFIKLKNIINEIEIKNNIEYSIDKM